MPVTTEAPATQILTFVLWIMPYGGWNWAKDGTTGFTRVIFQGPNADAMAADYISSHGHLPMEAGEDAASDWDAFPLTNRALNPLCEHQMSLHLCMGPDHFPSREQEMAMGW